MRGRSERSISELFRLPRTGGGGGSRGTSKSFLQAAAAGSGPRWPIHRYSAKKHTVRRVALEEVKKAHARGAWQNERVFQCQRAEPQAEQRSPLILFQTNWGGGRCIIQYASALKTLETTERQRRGQEIFKDHDRTKRPRNGDEN